MPCKLQLKPLNMIPQRLNSITQFTSISFNTFSKGSNPLPELTSQKGQPKQLYQSMVSRGKWEVKPLLSDPVVAIHFLNQRVFG